MEDPGDGRNIQSLHFKSGNFLKVHNFCQEYEEADYDDDDDDDENKCCCPGN
jgi:hypothetical protein